MGVITKLDKTQGATIITAHDFNAFIPCGLARGNVIGRKQLCVVMVGAVATMLAHPGSVMTSNRCLQRVPRQYVHIHIGDIVTEMGLLWSLSLNSTAASFVLWYASILLFFYFCMHTRQSRATNNKIK